MEYGNNMAQPQVHEAEGFFGKGEDIRTQPVHTTIVHPAEGFFGKGEDIRTQPVHTTTVHPKTVELPASSENEHSSASLHAVGTGNEVLENDAQSKGRWFAYLKTKQFWLTMLLGQGKSSPAQDYNLNSSANTIQSLPSA